MGAEKKTQKGKMRTVGIGDVSARFLRSYYEAGEMTLFEKTSAAVVSITLGLRSGGEKPEGVDTAVWAEISAELARIGNRRKANEDNGKKGGRPPKEKPNGNPTGTQTKPSLAREEEEGELDVEDSPPTPPEGGMVVVDGEDADWKKVVPAPQEIEDADKFWMFYPQRKGSKEQFRQSWAWACRYRGLSLAAALAALDDQETRGEFDEEHIGDAPWPAVWVRDGHWLNAAVPGGKKNGAAPAQGPLVAPPEERFASIADAVAAGQDDAGYVGGAADKIAAELEAARKAGVRI